MSMYIRVKREKLTVFMHVDPTDTVSAIKGKLQELLQKPAQDQRLYDKDGAELEDNRSLAEMRVENDDEISVTYRLDDGQFEAVSVARHAIVPKEEPV